MTEEGREISVSVCEAVTRSVTREEAGKGTEEVMMGCDFNSPHLGMAHPATAGLTFVSLIPLTAQEVGELPHFIDVETKALRQFLT